MSAFILLFYSRCIETEYLPHRYRLTSFSRFSPLRCRFRYLISCSPWRFPFRPPAFFQPNSWRLHTPTPIRLPFPSQAPPHPSLDKAQTFLDVFLRVFPPSSRQFIPSPLTRWVKSLSSYWRLMTSPSMHPRTASIHPAHKFLIWMAFLL